jgi:hypothetical protein
VTGPQKVLLHVGAPKTGTSFLQDVLRRNQDALKKQGILYPVERFDGHFLPALDLMELHWGGLERQAVGAWDRLAEQVRGCSGTVVISHEILARASRDQVRRALTSLAGAGGAGAADRTEVHVVLSVRDLARQIPAEWQENVKHRRPVGYRDFLDQITDPDRTGELASWFWGVQEVPDILDRWGATLPPERVHVVTVPKPGAPRGLLWQRFEQVLGIDGTGFDLADSRSNPSLGVPESALVRRINLRVNNGVLANRHYREFVRETLAHRTLSQRTASARLTLPEDVRVWAAQVSAGWVAELGARGYDVVGDLTDLTPDPVSAVFVDPDAPDETAVADAAMEAIVALLTKSAELRDKVESLHQEIADLKGEFEESRGPLGRTGYRIRRRVVHEAAHNRALLRALNGYRRLRGRSSRSA